MTRFLIGTLTRFGGPGVAEVALTEDRLSLEWVQGGLTDPNWLTPSATVPGRVYLVSSNGEGERKGCVHQAVLGPKGLVPGRGFSTGGNGPCHIALSGDERFLLVANYATGSVAVFPVGPDGLGERIQLIQWEGHGVNPKRQEGPHAHQVTYLPGLPGHVCATDLGTDQVYVYRQDPQTGLLSERYRLRLPHGEGPRHFIHTPGVSYLLTELGNKVFTVHFGENGGEVAGGVSTLPEGYAGANTGAAIRLSPDQKRLYCSNRGHGSIAVFPMERAEASRPPVPVGPPEWVFTAGSQPRDFILLPDGALLAACQDFGLTLIRGGVWVDRLPLMGAVCVISL